MSDLALSVRGLSKSYTIAHQATQQESTLAETVLQRLKRPFARSTKETFWALKDVSFDVKKGEVVGIIGRNGAGKSTLLKVLSRITEPTEGQIDLFGRVGSLLEVGTGFHPELTGRENVFLNGAILGMSRAEIKKQFDAIVDFAGVEKFLDTPVKRYSSGMYVRLAFAVAAHLRSEILIVDEVLAVGDAEFQKKCLGKMQDVAHDGRTVLFVSHNMAAVERLCEKCMLLTGGVNTFYGSAPIAVQRYGTVSTGTCYIRSKPSNGPHIASARLLTPRPRLDVEVVIECDYVLPDDVPGIKLGIGFSGLDGLKIFDSVPEDFSIPTPHLRGEHRAVFRLSGRYLRDKNYIISFALWRQPVQFDHVPVAFQLSMEPAPVDRFVHEPATEALVYLPCEWSLLT